MKPEQTSVKHKSVEIKYTVPSSNTSEEIKSTENTSSKSKIGKGILSQINCTGETL